MTEDYTHMDTCSLSLITGIIHFDQASYQSCKKTQKFETSIPNHVVRAIQMELIELGYREVGYIDGILGPRTKTAIRHHQRDMRKDYYERR